MFERPIVALVLAFLALGSIYSVITPIFEAGDEVWHYPFVQWLATGHRLPVQDPEHKGPWEQEGGQPPLYYAISAAATFWIDTEDMGDRIWRNPYARVGIPLDYGNKNLVVHTGAEAFPWRETTLAIHLLRFLSLFLSAGTVLCAYMLGREIFGSGDSGKRYALLGAAIVAFNPMFLFISASVNNDNLATALAALALVLIVRLDTRPPTLRAMILLGVVLGLAAVTKISDLALAPLAGLVVLTRAWHDREPRLVLRGAVCLGLPVVMIAGWWYLRNVQLYGDPFALNVWVQIAGGRPPISIFGLLDEFQGFRISFWGNMGGVNLIAPGWVYQWLDLFSILAVIGLVVARFNREWPRPLWIPIAWLILITVSLVRWTLMTYASQGRLIFPAITAVGLVFAFGFERAVALALNVSWRRREQSRRLSMALAWLPILFVASFALVAPFLIIAPAYALPSRFAAESSTPNPVHIKFAAPGNPELVGYELGRAATPSRPLAVTLYWRSEDRVPDDLYVYIHLYDRAGNRVGQWDSFPGNGLYPTRLWQPGEIIKDRYQVPVAPTDELQAGQVEVGLARVGTVLPLVARDPEGREITTVLGKFKLAGDKSPGGIKPGTARLGDSLDLLRLDVTGRRGITEFEVSPPREGALVTPIMSGDAVTLQYVVRAVRPVGVDYTAFVHFVDAQGRIVAQQDRRPQADTFPTSLLDPGDQVSDELVLLLPNNLGGGDYHLEFGLYGSGDLVRPPVAGQPPGAWSLATDHFELKPLSLEK